MGSGKLISDIPAAKKWHISKILSVFYRPRRDMQRRRYLNVYLFIVVDTHLSVCLLTERWVYQVFFSVFDLAESGSERSIRRPLLFWIHVIFFHSLPSRVGCSFQGKLFSIFTCKLFCLVFVRYYLSSRTAFESCELFVIALRFSWENSFADTRFVLLTQAINLSRLG